MKVGERGIIVDVHKYDHYHEEGGLIGKTIIAVGGDSGVWGAGSVFGYHYGDFEVEGVGTRTFHAVKIKKEEEGKMALSECGKGSGGEVKVEGKVGEEKRGIEFVIVDVGREEVHVKITKQTHRRNNFGNDDFGNDDFQVKNDKFQSKGGFSLISSSYPAMSNANDSVFVRGVMLGNDDSLIVFKHHSDFDRFKQAVKEYNEFDWEATSKMEKERVEKERVELELFEKQKDQVVESIKTYFEANRMEVSAIFEELKKAKTVGEFTEIKGRMCSRVLDLPTSFEHCLYCVVNGVGNFVSGKEAKCAKCEFGKKHGVCIKDDSLYVEMQHSLNDVKTGFLQY